ASGGGGEKHGRRVRCVMVGEEDLVARHAEMRGNDAANPDLLAQRVLDRVRKRSPRTRERAQRAGQDPLELQHAAFVEHDGIEVGWLELRVLEAPLDGLKRKAGVILLPGKTLFLNRADRHAGGDEARGGVVMVGGEAEDFHQYSLAGAAPRRAREIEIKPIGSRRSDRFANHANGGSRMKSMIVSVTCPNTAASAA